MKNLIIKNIKEAINLSEDVLEILKYSHFSPTKEKLSKLAKKYHEDKDILPFASFYENKILGIIVVQKIDNASYEIIDIAVDNNYRKQGIARSVCEWLIQKAKAQGAGKIYLETSACGRSLYQSLGFHEMRDYLKLDEDTVALE